MVDASCLLYVFLSFGVCENIIVADKCTGRDNVPNGVQRFFLSRKC
jgi:hypothetical protein